MQENVQAETADANVAEIDKEIEHNQEVSSTSKRVEPLWIKDYRKIHGYNRHPLAIRNGVLYALTVGILLIAQYLARKDSEGAQQLSTMLAGLGVFMGIVSVFYLNFSLITPLYRLTDNVLKMTGDINTQSQNIPCLNKMNEVGYIARALSTYHELNVICHTSAADAISSGEDVHHKKDADTQDIVHDFETNVKRVIEGVVSTTANAIFSTTRALTEITETSFKQAEGLESESKSSNETAARVVEAADTLAQGIREVNEQVKTSARIAQEALERTAIASQTVNKLEVTASEISEVIQIINRIASQINLLSLNATIEAARAGEAGRGFAVVASEVKSLARQVSDATDGIAQQVQSIQKVTGETVEAMNQISKANQRINESTNAISESMFVQAQTSRGIADNIKVSYNGTQKVSVISHDVSESALLTKQVVQDMRSITGDITQQSTMLEMQVKGFLNRIRGEAGRTEEEVANAVGEDIELF